MCSRGSEGESAREPRNEKTREKTNKKTREKGSTRKQTGAALSFERSQLTRQRRAGLLLNMLLNMYSCSELATAEKVAGNKEANNEIASGIEGEVHDDCMMSACQHYSGIV